ncbi:CrcB family protein [Halobaculum sp. MBLA0143]|uniref:fluoride efflux transporter FluC n=1 Tax=Halobaculum sp. MBLA0143 TaxID=3079933 RepID=UPI003524F08E
MDRTRLLLVAAGGAVGAVTRHAVGVAVGTPPGTLAANVAGSLLLGLLIARSLPDRVASFATTGFCSSFTTYSTFALETLTLPPPVAAAYVAGTYGLGIVAAAVGVRLGGRL